MGKEAVTLYTCERDSSHKQYIKDGDKEAEQWGVVKYVNSAGVTIERLACPKCLSEWAPEAERHDKEFKAFWDSDMRKV